MPGQLGGYHGFSNRFECAIEDAAVSPERSLDTPTIGVIPGGRIAQPARIHLRTLAILPAVSQGAVRGPPTGASGAYKSDDDGALRRTGDRPRHSPGRGKDAYEDPDRRCAFPWAVPGQRHVRQQWSPRHLPLQ